MTRFEKILMLVAAAALTGACGGGGADESVVSVPGASGAAAPSADRPHQIDQYRDCLVRDGITLLDHPTDEGLPQIDKNRTPTDKVATALEDCRGLLPAAGDADRPSPQDIEVRQRFAACLRDHGVPGYPDPDPVTGDPRLSDTLATQLKNDPKMPAAQEACQPILTDQPGGKGVVGG